MTDTDIRALNARAVRISVEIVSHLTDGDLGKPTPCSEWTVADLLAHMTVQHHGFAAAARGGGADPAVWEPRPLAADPAKAYAEAAEDVLAAYAEPGVLERSFDLHEFGEGAAFPGAQAISFHFLDYVVHGWDIARALGRPFELDDELAEPALKVALIAPTGEEREKVTTAFKRELPTPDGASTLDRILTHLGRSPSWPS
ncbi:TIGR03086 family protein [Actinomadura barringtoniae]|uniref:TIGR03086 family protein n=1 Tax=Actinomadura barringtoniae TaxID=1427535 RepID=A0A939PCX0_9ACTN|nr:TIGR03086 family metal-binding protein [Actinomadura barringtoniae]MBO2446161.1 TIGR03086 family protein [Actinomadura barringtoniae]